MSKDIWDSSASEAPPEELIAKDELFHDEPYYTWNPAEKALASQYLPAALESLTARQREAFKMKYEEGMTSQIEYLDAQTTLTNASISAIISRYDYHITYAEFERITALYQL